MRDPAPRALEIVPERHAKICAALEREARVLARRFLLLKLKSDARLLLLRFQLLAAELVGDLNRLLSQLILSTHARPLLRSRLGEASRESSAYGARQSDGEYPQA